MPDPATQSTETREPLTLARWVAGVLNRWRTIAATTLAVLVLSVAAALLLPPVYRVTVSFAPNPSSTSKLASAAGGLSALSGLSGQLGLGSMSEPTESPAFYAELLSSRELLTRLLSTKFPDPRAAGGQTARLVDIIKLNSSDPRRRMELGVKSLERSLRVESDPRTNLVKLTVDARYPELAAQEANATLALVNGFNLEQRTSRAREKRRYLEGRMRDAKNDLAVAQGRYRDFLASNRMWQTSPTLASRQENLQRDQDVALDLYMTLDKQYEAARLDEFNDASLVTIVDSAVAPVKPAWPRYSLLLPGAVLLGIFLGAAVAGVATVYADWSRRDPAAARELKAALTRRTALRRVP